MMTDLIITVGLNYLKLTMHCSINYLRFRIYNYLIFRIVYFQQSA